MAKKLLFVLTICLLLTSSSFAADMAETIEFGWNQEGDKTYLTQWEMHWSEAPGGPYEALVNIPYDSTGQLSYESPVDAVVTGLPNTTETRYFVLRACGDVLRHDGSFKYECSDWSNEVAYDFKIPWNGFQVPIQFKILLMPNKGLMP